MTGISDLLIGTLCRFQTTPEKPNNAYILQGTGFEFSSPKTLQPCIEAYNLTNNVREKLPLETGIYQPITPRQLTSDEAQVLAGLGKRVLREINLVSENQTSVQTTQIDPRTLTSLHPSPLSHSPSSPSCKDRSWVSPTACTDDLLTEN